METLDIIFLCCLVPALIVGIKKGAVSQIVSLLSVYLGINLSLKFSGSVSAWLLKHITISPVWVKIISFIIIFAAVAIIFSIIGKLLEKVMKVTMLGWFNRLIGALFAIAICILILSLASHLIDASDGLWGLIPKGKLENSKLYPELLSISKSVFPHLKALF